MFLPVHAHRPRFGTQSLAAAIRAFGVAAIFAQHHAHVQLVLLALHLREEPIHALEPVLPPPRACRAAPSRALPRAVRARARPCGTPSSAACLRSSVNQVRYLGRFHGSIAPPCQRQALVGNHQIHVEVDGVAESLAARTRAKRIVEAEQPRLRFASRPMAVRALIAPRESEAAAAPLPLHAEPLRRSLRRLAIGDLRRIHDARAILCTHHDPIHQHKHRQREVQIEQRFRRGEFKDLSR